MSNQKRGRRPFRFTTHRYHVCHAVETTPNKGTHSYFSEYHIWSLYSFPYVSCINWCLQTCCKLCQNMFFYKNALFLQVWLDQQCEHCHPQTQSPWKLCKEHDWVHHAFTCKCWGILWCPLLWWKRWLKGQEIDSCKIIFSFLLHFG